MVRIFPHSDQNNSEDGRFSHSVCSSTTLSAITKFNITIPTSNYMFKINKRNTTTWYDICSKLTIKTPERRYRSRSGVFIINFEYISHLALVLLLLTLSK